MALSLTAEQQSIFDMFNGKNQYIIPPYQRAYSWTETECKELFDDLKNAYFSHLKSDSTKDGYFLGNIVIARSLEDRNRLEIIDGQQRVTTLTLLMKVLLKFDETNNDLKNAIYIPEGRRGDISKRRLETNVFIKDDAQSLIDAIDLDLNDSNCKVTKKDNQFKQNMCFFYSSVEKFSKDNKIKDFIDFFLYDVTLLPIQTEDNDADKAREKALKIFETINDRGLSLSDSDIFKAKLYSNALNNLKHDDFIKKWNEFDENCRDIQNHISFKQKNPIDEVFRTYTYIIRGEKGNKGNEVSLRAFFLQQKDTPFKTKKYDEVLAHLNQIIEAIQFFGDVTKNPKKFGELTKWFQLINCYTNKFPLSVLLVYLYHNGLENTEKLEKFSKNLVKFAYGAGRHIDTMKQMMFDMVIKVMHDKELIFNFKSDKELLYSYSGSLRKGLQLLALYLNPKQSAIELSYNTDKIINSKDASSVSTSWENKVFDDYKDSLGNVLISDVPKRHIILKKRLPFYRESAIVDIQELIDDLEDWTYSKYEQRENELRKRLNVFFKVEDENK